MEEEIHEGAGHEVEVFQRLAKLHHPLGQGGKRGRTLGPDEEFSPVLRDGEQDGAIGVDVRRELLGVIQRVGVVQREGIDRSRGLLCLAAARQGQRGSGDGLQELMSCQFHDYCQRARPLRRLRASSPKGRAFGKTRKYQFKVKVRVYSISWGVLMATVSAVTASGVLRAATGISNVELPSVLVGRYFSPSTII